VSSSGFTSDLGAEGSDGSERVDASSSAAFLARRGLRTLNQNQRNAAPDRTRTPAMETPAIAPPLRALL
jgi:hypothetical protein